MERNKRNGFITARKGVKLGDMANIAVVAEQFPKKHPFKKLINAIRRDRFNWKRYTARGTWYGLEIQTQRVVCSYGIIGYEVYIYGGSGHFATITCDWEKEDITVNEW